MRRALSCLPLALLLIANVVPSKAQKGGAAGAEQVVRVRAGAPLELACLLRVEERAEWRREGGAMPPELRPAGEAVARGGLLARLRAPAARAHMAGVYACAPGPQAQRLRVLVEPDDAAAPGAAAETTPAPAEGAAGAADAGELGALLYYDLNRNATFNCTLPNPTKLPYVWTKNDTALTDLPELKDRHKLLEGGAVLELPRALEDDWGNYSCGVGGGAAAQRWRLHARVYTRLPSANTNVVEGQKLKLVCKVFGRPAPAVEWRYNESSAEPVPPAGDAQHAQPTALAADALGAERVAQRDSEAGVAGGELVVEAARRGDAGRFVCVPLAPPEGVAAAVPFGNTTLRVKDMYAALWPFLGICAEVLVLCAVILVYEKRRTKPELDDSDTDNHDQKKS